MLLAPLVLLVVVGYVVYRLVHRVSAHPAAAGGVAPQAKLSAPFLPTTMVGWIGAGAFVLAVLAAAAINLVQVPFLVWGLLAVTLVASALARFREHDDSAAVLGVLVVAGLGALAAALFVLGENLIGHD